MIFSGIIFIIINLFRIIILGNSPVRINHMYIPSESQLKAITIYLNDEFRVMKRHVHTYHYKRCDNEIFYITVLTIRYPT